MTKSARFIGLLAAAYAASISAVAGALQQPIVRIDSGPLIGDQADGLVAFRGIPYAAPPVGELRWRPPRAPNAWTKPLDATKFRDQCPQNNDDAGAYGAAGGEENCLFLNVFAPQTSREKEQKLPVLFWIHGGGLFEGAGSDYDAKKLAVQGRVVVVTINYRLGLLGFLADPGLDHEGHEFADYGLMDQQFALGWVQRNIAAFGGDPKNVTIFGESSGSCSVFAHLISPDSAGKFQQAIAMSCAVMAMHWSYLEKQKASPADWLAPPLDFAEKRGADFARAVGCNSMETACLRKLPVKEILEYQKSHLGYLVESPIVDGKVIPLSLPDAFESGKLNRVPLITGTTLDEGTIYPGLTETTSGVVLDEQGYARAIEVFFGKELAPKLMQEYPLSDYPTASDAYAAAISAANACAEQAIDRWAARKMPTYVYEFTDRTAPAYVRPTTFALGASHGFELPYLFPGFDGVKLNPLQEKLSDQMVRYWSQASRAQRREAEWPRYDPGKQDVLSLVLPSARMAQGRFDTNHNCHFWDSTGIY